MISEDALEELIIKNKGNLSAVARQVPMSRSGVGKRVAESDRLKTACQAARDEVLDEIEDKLFERAKQGETTEMIFVMKTIGKERGYVERSEVKTDGNLTINVKYEEE